MSLTDHEKEQHSIHQLDPHRLDPGNPASVDPANTDPANEAGEAEKTSPSPIVTPITGLDRVKKNPRR